MSRLMIYGEDDENPLVRLYNHEDYSIMREKIKGYIGELETEIKRLEDELLLSCNSIGSYEEPKNAQKGQIWICGNISEYESKLKSRISTLQEVINDLKGRLEEGV